METGYCESLFRKALEIVKKLYPRIPNVNILPWTVYTKKDINYILLRIQTEQVKSLAYLG